MAIARVENRASLELRDGLDIVVTAFLCGYRISGFTALKIISVHEISVKLRFWIRTNRGGG